MAFFLFILVNAMLFVRPAEVFHDPRYFPDLTQYSIYETLIIACLLCSFVQLIALFYQNKFWSHPITILILAFLVAIVLSGIRNLGMDTTLMEAFEFAKVIVYFVLLVALVNTPQKLKVFLFWILIFSAVMSSLAILRYHEVIELKNLKAITDQLEETAVETTTIRRMQGTGIFNDPNDFCMLCALAIPLVLYWMIDGTKVLLYRVLFSPLLILFGYALSLTQSRSGFLAVLIGVLTVLRFRFTSRLAYALIILMIPAAFLVYAGRQTDVFTTEGTAGHRFELWQDGITMLKENPLFGVGVNQYAKHAGLVAHNSFIHAYGELGVVGGVIFFCLFFVAVWMMYRFYSHKVFITDPTLRRLHPYLFGILVGNVVLMLTLSRCYEVPTFLLLGLVVIQTRLAVALPPLKQFRLKSPNLEIMLIASACFLFVMYVAMRILVRYS